MIYLGADVHKQTHTVALIDGRGIELGTLTIANDGSGFAKLAGWLKEHATEEVLCGIENAAGYGRLLAEALLEAGYEVLSVPAWRTYRERQRQDRGKSDPADALAIAQAVMRHRAKLGPALEPELVRAISLLDSLRRQLVGDRTKAIVRLRAIWTQVDPVAEAKTGSLAKPRFLRKAKRVSFGEGVAEKAAALCIRELAASIERLNGRVARADEKLACLLELHGSPVEGLKGAGVVCAATLIAQAGDVRRFRSEAAFARYCGVAPIPCGSGKTDGRHRLDRGGNRQLNAVLHRIAVVQARCNPEAKAYLARKQVEGKTKKEARRALKRHLANVVYRHLHEWARGSQFATPA